MDGSRPQSIANLCRRFNDVGGKTTDTSGLDDQCGLGPRWFWNDGVLASFWK